MKYSTKLGLIKAHPDAKLPTQKVDDIGFDIYAVEDVSIPHMSVGKIDTGLQFATNPHYPTNLDVVSGGGIYTYDERWSIETKIEGRSGMASKGIFPVGGEIDGSYRGNFIVCLLNLTGDIYKVKKGDKIAQLVLRPVLANTDSHHVEFVFRNRNKQEETERGMSGFGSTGR